MHVRTEFKVVMSKTFTQLLDMYRFVRPIMPNDKNLQVDRALNIDSFILYGYITFRNPSSNIMSFPVHDVTPTPSTVMINPSINNNQPFNGITVPVSCWLKRNIS